MKKLPEPHFVHHSNDGVDKRVIENASLFSSLADISYQPLAVIKWKLDIDEAVDIASGNFVYFDDCLTTQGFIIKTEGGNIIVVFRGSEIETMRAMFEDWAGIDCKMKLIPFPSDKKSEEKPEGGKVHAGFLKGLMNVWNEQDAKALNEKIMKEKTKIWFTGHSLGAALATMAASCWASKFGTSNIGGVYTFGSPKCGNASFVNYYNEMLSNITFRFVNQQDIVPALPFVDPSFKNQASFWVSTSAYSIFSCVSKQMGESVYNGFNFITGREDSYYQHVGGNPYYLHFITRKNKNEDKDISECHDKERYNEENESGKIVIRRELPSNFTRLRPRNLNPLSLTNWVFHHDYKEYVKKILENTTCKLTPTEVERYKNIFSKPYNPLLESKCILM